MLLLAVIVVLAVGMIVYAGLASRRSAGGRSGSGTPRVGGPTPPPGGGPSGPRGEGPET